MEDFLAKEPLHRAALVHPSGTCFAADVGRNGIDIDNGDFPARGHVV